MKKIFIVSLILISSAGILVASNSYAPRWKPVKNNSCPKNFTKKNVGSRVRCFENCRPGYSFKVQSKYTNNGGVVSYMECVK